MSSLVEDYVEKLKEQIFSLPETKEFLRLEALIESDKLLKGMRIEIAKLSSEGKIKERDNLLNEYNSLPLISNYNVVKEELISILNEISKNIK